ncbi:unnamed protein product [Echinostoma caproni]|uniref:Uncharacterized protein n=1 Tax=Echinostoma caproni TaxID=27848 RepID=A0A183AYD5_9TREM|nr:unnamed protein product [Echinostoma caproni]
MLPPKRVQRNVFKPEAYGPHYDEWIRVTSYTSGKRLKTIKSTHYPKIGQAMVEITYLTDATVHRRHIEQIHFNETSISKEAPVEEIQKNPPSETPSTPTEFQRQQSLFREYIPMRIPHWPSDDQSEEQTNLTKFS